MSESAPFDGVICIGGEDWWYHNRGHFDFQIMRRLAANWPVLFVNSLAVRMPSVREGGQFAGRISRKVRSLAKGLIEVEKNFWVMSPLTVPGAAGQAMTGWALAPQIRLAAARAGIKRPLLWVHCPAGARLVNELDPVAIVLQRTDRFEAFPEADAATVASQIAELKSRADLVIYCNEQLLREERSHSRRQMLVTHGVELDAFASAGDGHASEPADVARLAKPRVGFIGGIDAHTFDPELFLETARRLPDATFVMIGACSLPEGWCNLDNVHFLGRKPYDQVAAYMAAMDALIMPWNSSDWIAACNPIKLKEYLAVGRPVITTDFPALAPYRDLVRIAANPADFAAAIKSALNDAVNPENARARIAGESWDRKASEVADALKELAANHKTPRAARPAA